MKPPAPANKPHAPHDGRDIKTKLAEFIAPVLKSAGGIESGPKFPPPPYTASFQEQVSKPTYTLGTDPTFLALTGTTFLEMIKSWAKGGDRTSCNDFVCQCGYHMGATTNLGKFELESILKETGKGHAWVPANSGRRPNYGDIFRSASYHMGVSLQFEGDTWHTVEGGQGGARNGCDVVKHKTQTFNPASLQGWCDMHVYLDPRPRVPDWLAGTWLITHGGDEQVYVFNERHEVFHYAWNLVGSRSQSEPLDKGDLVMQAGDHFAVRWQNNGMEKFEYARFESLPGITEKMIGTNGFGKRVYGIRHVIAAPRGHHHGHPHHPAAKHIAAKK